MNNSTAITATCVASLLLLAGCVTTGEGVKPESSASTPIQAVAAQGGLSVNQVAERRNIERELDRDHAAYLKFVGERNVEEALGYVLPEKRAEKQTELWQFVAEYSFSNFEVADKKVEYGPDAVTAEIRAVLVVFQKNVVAPAKKDYVTKWRRVGDKWLLAP